MKKKWIALLVAVFATTFAVGFSASRVATAADCYYRCICSKPHKCCVVNGVEVCKPVNISPIQCPQRHDC